VRALFAWLCLAAVAGACTTGLSTAALAGIDELIACPELAGARVGVAVVDATDGATIAAAMADRGFAPASNQKLLSSAIALTTLGPDHRLPTELWLHGEVQGGELRGELRLCGHGDPTFADGPAGRAALAELAAAVRALGVRRFTGRIVGDDRWLGPEHLGLGWQWDYLDEDYAAPFGALCAGHNQVLVRVKPGPNGAETMVEPDWYGPVEVRIGTGARGSVASVVARRAIGSDLVSVTGSLPVDAEPRTLAVTVRDPAGHAANTFAAALRAAGIEVDRRDDVALAGEPRLLAGVSSPPLADLVAKLLLDSDNLYAEQVWRTASRVATGDGGTAAAAGHGRRELERLGVDCRGLVMADGSGLSRRNLVQPRQLAALLLAMHRAPLRDVFQAGLPVGGRSGTLRNRFRDGPASGRVRAKTGFISRVVCLSGYLPRPQPGAEPLVFSVMVNDFTGDEAAVKAAVDTFVQRLAAALGW
jgi:D-alanyl-D-alanine carboxypeptidase/D-alanyl-D-alanine-endopeptidase (penicillin-binding protein 4)